MANSSSRTPLLLSRPFDEEPVSRHRFYGERIELDGFLFVLGDDDKPMRSIWHACKLFETVDFARPRFAGNRPGNLHRQARTGNHEVDVDTRLPTSGNRDRCHTYAGRIEELSISALLPVMFTCSFASAIRRTNFSHPSTT